MPYRMDRVVSWPSLEDLVDDFIASVATTEVSVSCSGAMVSGSLVFAMEERHRVGMSERARIDVGASSSLSSCCDVCGWTEELISAAV